MKQQAAENVIGGASAGAVAAGSLGFAVETDPMFIAAAIVGGMIGAGIAARAAFDDNDERPVGQVALTLAFSMMIGVSAGFFLAGAGGELLGLTRLQTVALAFIVSVAGERAVGVLGDRLVEALRKNKGSSE